MLRAPPRAWRAVSPFGEQRKHCHAWPPQRAAPPFGEQPHLGEQQVSAASEASNDEQPVIFLGDQSLPLASSGTIQDRQAATSSCEQWRASLQAALHEAARKPLKLRAAISVRALCL
ncbi:hypothetical protein Dimus_024832 [Dionaea muscipula]